MRGAEPYGVAELFRQCLESAWVFRERHIGSVWRLFLTVAGSIALVALMGVLAWVFFLIRLSRQQEIGSSAEVLRNKVNIYLTHVAEQSPLARYRNARSRIDEIKSLEKDPGFAGLPRQEKDALACRRQELEDYLNYEMQVALLTDPATITDESLLKDAQTKLGEAAKVSENHIDWMDAEAGRRYAEIENDTDSLTTEVDRLKQKYRELIDDGNRVLETSEKEHLPKRAAAVLEKARNLPNQKNDTVKVIPR